MRNIKKVMILLCLFIVSTSILSFAENDKTEIEVDVLHQLGLIVGDGVDFKLEKTLTRAEAATFIVRLLGQETEVITRKAMYSNSNFSDVKGDEWFAPYIGYCERNYILTGYPDGSARPNDTLSEKEFLIMISKALGYNSSDFSWDSIYRFAYKIGLVNDLSYIDKEVDNRDYLRKSVVNIMFVALNQNVVSKDISVLENLIEEEIVSKSLVDDLSLIPDDKIELSIDKIKTISKHDLEITFNEEVRELLLEQVNITLSSNSKSNLNITEMVLNGNVMKIKTEEELHSSSYMIMIHDIFDSSGNLTKSLSSSIVGYEVPEYKSNYFTISKIKSVSKDKIEVYFTHPINSNIMLASNFTFIQDGKEWLVGDFSNLDMALIGGTDNGLAIKLKEKVFYANANYTLKVKSSTRSLYGSYINGNKDLSREFITVGDENDAIKVVSVEPINVNHIRVIFNKDVNMTSALSTSNYKLKDLKFNTTTANAFSVVASGEGDLQYRQIDIKWANLIPQREYELTIDNIKDSLKSSLIDNQIYPIVGRDFSNEEFKLEYVAIHNSNEIELYFNQPIRSDSINATIAGVNDIKLAYDSTKPYQLKVYIANGSEIASGNTYNVQLVTGIYDIYGNNQMGLSYSLEGATVPVSNIIPNSATAVSKRDVLIKFNASISNVNAANKFRIEYEDADKKKVTINATAINFVSANEVVVTFEDDLILLNYSLVISNLTDYSNQFTTVQSISGIDIE